MGAPVALSVSSDFRMQGLRISSPTSLGMNMSETVPPATDTKADPDAPVKKRAIKKVAVERRVDQQLSVNQNYETSCSSSVALETRQS